MVIFLKNDRMFRILYILLEKQGITAPELAQMLEVSVRTVYRDIEALSMAGVPVRAMAGKGGGISIMPGYSFQKAMLTEKEQSQLLVAVQSLHATGEDTEALASKLGSIFQKEAAGWLEVDFSRWGCKGHDSEKFEIIKGSVIQKRILHIRYFGSSGKSSERDIKPFKLIFKNKNWYLQAFCMSAEGYRVFKINRICQLNTTDDTFNDDFSGAPAIEIDDSPPASMARLKLKFSPGTAYRIYEEFNPEDITQSPDGYLYVNVEFPFDNWVCGYILSFGDQVEVIEPEFVRKSIAGMAENIFNIYQT